MAGATVRSDNQKGKIASRMGRRNLKTCVGIEIRSGAADGGIRREGTGDDSVMAFTDFGIETLKGLVEIYKANPDLLSRSNDPT